MQWSVIFEWMARLLPKQKMQDAGSGNVQAGRVEGDLHHTQNTHSQVVNHFNLQYTGDPSQLAAALIRAQALQAHQPEDTSSSAPQPAFSATKEGRSKSRPTEKQEAILALMRKNDFCERVTLAFMQREFQSTYVKGLTDQQAKRVIGYVETAIRNEEAKAAIEGEKI